MSRAQDQRILFFQIQPTHEQLAHIYAIKDKWIAPPGFALQTNEVGVTTRATLSGREYVVRGRNYLGEFTPQRLRVYFNDGRWMLRLEATKLDATATENP